MNLVRSIAKRFVMDKKASGDPAAKGFVSFIAMISVAGLALGVTALLVVTSVMNGFERTMKSGLTAFHGHVLLFSRAEPVAHPEKWISQIQKDFPEVTGITPYIFAEGMLRSKSAVSGTVVEGVDLETFRSVSRIEQKIIAGRMPTPTTSDVDDVEVVLGVEIARKIKAELGDRISLTIPFAKGDAPIARSMKVVGFVRLGMYDYDSKYAIVPLLDLQKLLEIPGKVNAFKIVTKDQDTSYRVTTSMNEKYVYPMRARDWSSLNANLFRAIQLEKAVISIILMAIVLVASFNVVSTILMMVQDKKRQISMLKAIGFTRRQSFSVFLWIGSVMAGLGTLLGLGFGRALCSLLAWKSIIDLPADVYMLSRLPVEIRPFEWALICVLTIALAIVSTLWPSYRVSRESAVEGLRYE